MNSVRYTLTVVCSASITLLLFTLLLFSLLLFSLLTWEVAQAQTVTRLTSYQGHDLTPAWDPRGVTIAYLRAQAIGQNFFAAYKVESSGLASEQALLTGLNTDFGVATTTSWIGSTGFLVVEEAISGFEVLKFDTTLAPFDRTAAQGSDAANTVLLAINGGGGGGLSKISRDGLVALERVSTSGSSGAISVRVGPVSSMTGQVSTTFGTALISTSSNAGLYLNGGGLNADGSKYVISAPSGSGSDLVLGSTSHAFADISLTSDGSSGVQNVFPDISPDGTRIVFARSTPSSNGMYDLWVINADGTGLTQLTNTPNFSENRPSWSPDGGSVAFDGIHRAGHESEAPALAAGESANLNIYVLTLPPANIVTPKTKLADPPLVRISNRTATFTLAPFLKAQLGAVAKRSATERKAKTTVSFKYALELVKTGRKGTRREILAKRNTISAKNLKPGNYNVRYRIQITSKTPSKPTVVKNTKFSPRAAFQIAG